MKNVPFVWLQYLIRGLLESMSTFIARCEIQCEISGCVLSVECGHSRHADQVSAV